MDDTQKCRWTHRILDKIPFNSADTEDILALMDYAYEEGREEPRE